MKFRIFSTFLIIVLFVGMMPLAPAASTMSTSNTISNDLELSALPARNVRVAILYDPDSSDQTYAYLGLYPSNFSGVMDVLTGAGYQVTNITRANLVAHELQTVNYDVLVLPDIVPEDDLLPAIEEFWLSGGGVLSIDGSISILCYTGMLPAASAGDNGHGTYWSYGTTELQVVQSVAPATRSYTVGDKVNVTYTGYAYYNWSALTAAVSPSSQLTALLVNDGAANNAGGVAFDPVDRGGRIVQVMGTVYDLQSSLNQLVIDAVDWLAPRPRARIAFDLSHQPRLGIDSWDNLTEYPGLYESLRDAYVARDYVVDKLYPSPSGNLTAARLDDYDMLIIVSPDYNYTASEVTAVRNWVDGGGSLFVMGDFAVPAFAVANDQINSIVQPMGMYINDTVSLGSYIADASDHFTTEECVGIDISGLSATGAINITGGSVSVVYEGEGNVLIAAATYGSGQVILSADINWATNTYFGDNTNERFAVNVANWLTSFDAPVVLYSTDTHPAHFEIASSALALNELELPYLLVHSLANLNESLNAMSRSLLIMDVPNNIVGDATGTLTRILDYVNAGGRLLMTTYQMNEYPDHSLWSALGVAFSESFTDNPTLYMWDSAHPIFNTPIDFAITQFDATHSYIDDGDTVYVFDNATSLAGRTSLSTENESLIVLRDDEQTLLNSYIIDVLADNDDSGYPDSYEFYLNEIAFMLKPTIDSPADVAYTAGATGNSITWTPQSHAPASYSITRNGTGIDNGTWTGGAITVDVDGLDPGTYVYQLTVTDLYGETATDEVVVQVSAGGITLPGGVTLPDNLLLYILIGLVVLIIIIVVIKKR